MRPSELLELRGNAALAFDLGITLTLANEEKKQFTGEYWWVPVMALAKSFMEQGK